MSDIEKILGKDALRQICAEVGDTDEQEVERVLESILPQLEAECDSGEVAQRAAVMQQDTERGLGGADLLSLLLGSNLGGVTSQVSQSTGVSQNKTGSILKIAAPLLLVYLLKKKASQSQQQAQFQQQQQLQQLQQIQYQPQNQQSSGLFDMLFGGQQVQQTQQSHQGSGLFDMLFGGQQTQSQQSGDLLGGLMSLLGGRSMPGNDGDDKE